MKVGKSQNLINLFFLLVMICLLGMIILPTIWLYTFGAFISIGYFLFMVLHFLVFILSICPKCAMRNLCPTAKLSNSLHNVFCGKEFLEKD